MTKFNRYKVNASELGDLMGNEKGYKQPTEEDLAEFFKILDKNPVYVTEKQKIWLQSYVLDRIDFEKNPFPLSGTAKSNIYKHYAFARFGANKLSNGGRTPLQLDKGEIAEPDAIKLLSKIDGVEYTKNEKLLSNKYFKGIPDVLVYEGEKIVSVKEIKVPMDLVSFLERVDGDHLIEDRWEILAYMDILGLKSGEIVYCLVDMPKNVRDRRIEEQKNRYISLGYEQNHIKKLLKRLENSMTYEYVPEEKRVVRFSVSPKGWCTSQMHRRVKIVRERLQVLHEKFEKGLFLFENSQKSPLENTF